MRAREDQPFSPPVTSVQVKIKKRDEFASPVDGAAGDKRKEAGISHGGTSDRVHGYRALRRRTFARRAMEA
jgi:hypothetical protein